MNPFALPTVAERLKLTLEGLCRVVAARFKSGAMAVVMIHLVWTRVKRAEGRLQALLVRFRTGLLPMSARSRVGVRKGAGKERTASAALGLPRRLGWLLPLVPYEAANFSSQLRVLLADPEMVALLEASAQARRILKPVCRMLGIEEAVLVAPATAAPVRSAPGARPREPVATRHHAGGACDRSLDLLPAPFT